MRGVRGDGERQRGLLRRGQPPNEFDELPRVWVSEGVRRRVWASVNVG